MSGTTIRSPLKAMVWKIEVEVGQAVEEHDDLVILESMKTEIPVQAVSGGVVREILVKESDAVEEDQPLVVIESAS